MGAPTMFMMTQLYTWGESNLSDTSILYMSDEETALYFMFNTWWVMQHYVYSLFHVSFFGIFYFMDLIMIAFKSIYGSDAMGKWDDDDDDDMYSKGDKLDDDDKSEIMWERFALKIYLQIQ